MNESIIRWTKDDKQNLRKAVNNFNSKIKRLEKEGRENLPDKVSYKELVGIGELQNFENKNRIYSRGELNNVIRSLQRFSKRGAEDIVTLKSGEQVTKWQKREIGIAKSRAIRSLNKRISEIEVGWGMGNAERQELEATKKAIEDATNRKGYSFKRTLEIIKNNARSDRELRKAEIWAYNFKKGLDQIKNYENSELLIEAVNRFKNPIKLWEFVSQNELMEDFFLWYDAAPQGNELAGFDSNQEAFNYMLQDLKLL